MLTLDILMVMACGGGLDVLYGMDVRVFGSSGELELSRPCMVLIRCQDMYALLIKPDRAVLVPRTFSASQNGRKSLNLNNRGSRGEGGFGQLGPNPVLVNI